MRRLSVVKYRSRVRVVGFVQRSFIISPKPYCGTDFFAPCHVGTTCKGDRMSISFPDKKMDDYARDCVVRLASRVDDKVLRERLLQMVREWNAAAMDEGNRSSAVTGRPIP